MSCEYTTRTLNSVLELRLESTTRLPRFQNLISTWFRVACAGAPASFGRLVAACDANMIAYAQLEVMAMLPSLRVAKLQAPARVDEADLKVRDLPCHSCRNSM